MYNIAVIGAGGKMGRGIAQLLLQTFAFENVHLHLIDRNEEVIYTLKSYLRKQMASWTEKNINDLRKHYTDNPNLISNLEMIETFMIACMDRVHVSTDWLAAKNSNLIFEAVVEDLELKAALFSKLKQICTKNPYYFTNTSSIPIHTLNKRADLGGKIIGFHFYNPPPVQRLLELIIPEGADPKAVSLSEDMAKRLKKTIVYSNDIAGFIGNGHFIREIAFACEEVERLSKDYSQEEAIWLVDTITREHLIRPMGIFQLVDYVAIDVVLKIAGIMNIPLDLISHVQCEILQFDPPSVYSLEKKQYCSIKENWKNDLGPLPEGYKSWKQLQKKSQNMQAYRKMLYQSDTLGSKLAVRFLDHSREIAQGLVDQGIAKSLEDVNTVLECGFYHVFGLNGSMVTSHVS